MSLPSLNNLINEFPKEEEPLSRINNLIDTSEVGKTLFTLNKLYETSRFSSQFIFNYVLDRLVSDGVLKKIIRVETEHGGVDDFQSINDVPNELIDWRTSEKFTVTPRHIKILYKLESKK